MSGSSTSISSSLAAAQQAAKVFIETNIQKTLDSIDDQIRSLSSRILAIGKQSWSCDFLNPNIKGDEVDKIFSPLNDITRNYKENFYTHYMKVSKYVDSYSFRFLKFIGRAPKDLEKNFKELKPAVSIKISEINKRTSALNALRYGVDIVSSVKNTNSDFVEIHDFIKKEKSFLSEKSKIDFTNKCKENLEKWKAIKEDCESFKDLFNSGELFTQGDYSFVFDYKLEKISEIIANLEDIIDNKIPKIKLKENAVVSSSSKSSDDGCFFVWVILFFEMLGSLMRAA